MDGSTTLSCPCSRNFKSVFFQKLTSSAVGCQKNSTFFNFAVTWHTFAFLQKKNTCVKLFSKSDDVCRPGFDAEVFNSEPQLKIGSKLHISKTA